MSTKELGRKPRRHTVVHKATPAWISASSFHIFPPNLRTCHYGTKKKKSSPVSTFIVVGVQSSSENTEERKMSILQREWLIFSGLSGRTKRNISLTSGYETRPRLNSDQKPCRIIKKLRLLLLLLFKKKRERGFLEKYNHWKHITISSLCVCVVKDGSCDSPSTSYVHKTMLMWITWPASGPGPPVDDAEGIKNCFTFSAKCYFSCRAQFLGFFVLLSLETPAGCSTSPKKCEASYQLQRSTLYWLSKWHSGSLLVLRSGANPLPTCEKQTLGIISKQLEEVTTVIICLWRSHCNIQLSVNGRDRLLSRSISHYLTVASWGKKKKKSHLQAMAPYNMYRIDQTYLD